MTREMLQGENRHCNMGGLPAQQQNPTGGRRLGYRGAVGGRLWIFAGVIAVIGHQRKFAPTRMPAAKLTH